MPDQDLDRVDAVVQRVLLDREIRRAVAPDEDLRETGLTSLDMVSLVLSVEAEFDLKVPDGDITPANFRSIAAIRGLVAGLLAGVS